MVGEFGEKSKKEAFPELLGGLKGLQQVDTRTDWPLKKLALLRWYQADARSFLKWIRENLEVCPKGNFEVVICEIVQEEYHTTPSFSYEVIEKLVLELGAYPEGAKESEWTYNIGMYSRDLPLRLECLESLYGFLKHGDSQLSPNRSANGWRDEDNNRDTLIRGTLDRDDGGLALTRSYFSEGYDGRLAVGQRSFRFLGLSDYTRTYLERLEIAELVEIEMRRLNLIEVISRE